MDKLLPSIIALVFGLIFGVGAMIFLSKAGFNRSQEKAKLILDEAENKAKNIVKQAVLDGKTYVHDLKLQTEKEIKESKKELNERENKLVRREDSLNSRDENLIRKEKSVEDKLKKIEEKNIQISKMEDDLRARIEGQIVLLERVSNLSAEDAKKELMEVVERQMKQEVETYIKEQEEEAIRMAEIRGREILASAIQRYSQDEVIERTVSVVSLPNEEMKGRIIGREGRNIRALEQATGVDLIIDDTPETITISCFNPIRREIAKVSLESLIRDGRIQPGRIEEVVKKTEADIERIILKAGEEAIFKLKLGKMDKELVKLLGRMRYRYSYGQNGLLHSMEVAFLSGIIAAELGLNQQLAKRAGLLHDIGKALDFEMDGTHVELGVKVAKKYGENDIVINAIAAHHGDVPPTHLISNVVAAADTLSAARPGARHEGLENYIQRLENLEKVACDFEGVEKAYAIQAGREVRVMVVPEKVNDSGVHMLARNIKEKIESDLTYPGQIKVTLIREVRAQEIAK